VLAAEERVSRRGVDAHSTSGDAADVLPTGELVGLAKLTANWRSVVGDAALTKAEKEERRTGQQKLL